MYNKTEIISRWLKIIFHSRLNDFEINSIYFQFEKESKKFKIIIRMYSTRMSTNGPEKIINDLLMSSSDGKYPPISNYAPSEQEFYHNMSQKVQAMMGEMSIYQKKDWEFITSWSSHDTTGSYPLEWTKNDKIDSLSFFKGEADLAEFKKQLNTPLQSIH